ncbi:hypothetical protein OEZ85_006422 [Tetradesmus obliquus]|uniref:Uncharacterized protein n=1 Tax=Tetradesmus obliquus TaxID=3088 RepID=A0ABY8TUK1_TETOB|nr:hypothetical protein OEZ85_006422 [Tetradesmus obliquus]
MLLSWSAVAVLVKYQGHVSRVAGRSAASGSRLYSMGANAEEPNPFGAFGNHHNIDDDEFQDHPGGMLTADNTINVLDSPFASSNIHNDLEAEAANSSKSAANNSRPAQNRNELPAWSTGSAGASASAAAKAAAAPGAARPAGTAGAAGDLNNSNGAVVDILESPFVSACLSQDLKNIEAELAAAAAAEELSNSAAALNIGGSSSASSKA